MIEEESSIANEVQEIPTTGYDKFSEKEKGKIAQRVREEAISMGELSRNQFRDWEKVVIGLSCGIWKSIVRKVMPSFVSFSLISLVF